MNAAQLRALAESHDHKAVRARNASESRAFRKAAREYRLAALLSALNLTEASL